MIPIVFCASFVPWVSATKPPETSCRRRKMRLTFAGERRLITQTIARHQGEREREARRTARSATGFSTFS